MGGVESTPRAAVERLMMQSGKGGDGDGMKRMMMGCLCSTAGINLRLCTVPKALCSKLK